MIKMPKNKNNTLREKLKLMKEIQKEIPLTGNLAKDCLIRSRAPIEGAKTPTGFWLMKGLPAEEAVKHSVNEEAKKKMLEFERGRPVIKTNENLFGNKWLPNEALNLSNSSFLKGTSIEDHPGHLQQTFWQPGLKKSDIKVKGY